MKKILVTGGAGFVGRRFVKYFLDKGDQVIVVDNIAKYTGGIDPNNGWPLYNPKNYKNFKFILQDCREWFKNNKDTDFDYVLHLAAMVGGREIIENNPMIVADDLSIDCSYWQWAVECKPKKTLCFSSSACYPIALQTKKNYRLLKENDVNLEKSIGFPDLAYGWAKLSCEYLAKIAFNKYNLKSENIAYIGDDINDLEALKYAGLSAAPPLSPVLDYFKPNLITKRKAGKGAFRDLAELILRSQNLKIVY